MRPRHRWGHPWKRADITPAMLVGAVHRHGMFALDELQQTLGVPPKVLVAAVLRDVKTGYLTYGVTVWRPLLDWRGQRMVDMAKEVRRANSQGHSGHGGGGDRSHRDERGRHCEVGAGDTADRAPDRQRAHEDDPPGVREGMSMVDVGITSDLGMWRVTVSYDAPDTGRTVTQSAEGTAQTVAAFLRSVADQADPPKKPHAPGHR